MRQTLSRVEKYCSRCQPSQKGLLSLKKPTNLPLKNSKKKPSNSSPEYWIENAQINEHEARALAELSAVNPDLADLYVNRLKERDALEDSSEKFGLIIVAFVATCILICITLSIIFGSVISVGILVLLFVAGAFFFKVVISGEWSDTSWFGTAINGLVRMLGGKPTSEDIDDSRSDDNSTE